jgi:hypothetical protein
MPDAGKVNRGGAAAWWFRRRSARIGTAEDMRNRKTRQRELIARQHERLAAQEMELARLRQTLDARLAAHEAPK